MKTVLVAVAAAIAALVSGQSLVEKRKADYEQALKELDFDAVIADLKELIVTSQDFFPADYGNYGPFFMRLAWHCAGTYRILDGEGGCDGGRQRFEPERSWPDNTQLDKARTLLFPLKEKYGVGLSWGDLFVLAGTVGIEVMGGPVLGFCGGRFDSIDGEESVILGPSDLQREVSPCPLDGNCSSPLGAFLLEHIYVNPNGFLGDPDPAASVPVIREAFRRMGMNDAETVALIGGGHSFGKNHGACPLGAGEPPRENPENPWAGNCGTGVGVDTFTSGFEGPWTSTPTEFTNNYFRALANLDFEIFQGPGGNNQFRVPLDAPFRPQAPNVDGVGTQDITMLITDISLIKDPIYADIVNMYAEDIDAFANSFQSAWYKLMTRDMGPASRCVGPMVPPAQEFQAPLPQRSTRQLSRRNLRRLFRAANQLVDDDQDFKKTAFLTETAYLCAATYRDSDNNGGCNGARIRLDPERRWSDRTPLIPTLGSYDAVLSNTEASVADLIVLAGTKVLQKASGGKVDFTFCPGRVDADSAPLSNDLKLFRFDDKALEQTRQARLFGVSELEYVALQGRPRSPAYMKILGYQGSYTDELNIFTNTYARTLLSETWTRVPGTENLCFGQEFVNEDGTKFITYNDFVLLLDDVFLAALFELAADEDFFLNTFQGAWTKLMNADRFDGPISNECENGKVPTFVLGRGEPGL